MDAPTIDQVSDEIRDATLQVHQAQERQDERDVVVAALESIERVASTYRDLLQGLSEGDRLRAERLLGRRLVDLKRLGSLLPKVPMPSRESTPDRVAGAGAIGQRRITGVSWSPHDRAAPTGAPKVGSDIEAWCGKCGESTTHSIVAMVGAEPKQVLCQVCNSRHAYRTSPARKRATAEGGAAGGEGDLRPRVAVDPEAARRAAAMRALGEEVAAAQEVRRFDPKERYKAGEIISHPVYGRGKIENVLRSSLLVRFSVGGLKSLMLA
ncbi:MAG TPA: hypothetical protein VHJ20_17870 [Polyangia bacterium]|nr:hypothetical protein [Polyangia bacterium]